MAKNAMSDLAQSETNLGRRYYFSMLSLAVVVLTISTISTSTFGHIHHLRDHVLGTGFFLVILNLIGARLLFAPIAQYLAGRVEIEVARPRLLKLPIISAAWAFALVLVHMYLQFFFHHVWFVRDATNLLDLLIYPSIHIAIFGMFMGLFIYFLIGDYTALFREEIFSRHRVVIEPGAGRVLYKLVIAFFAVSAVPLSFLFFRLFFFEDSPHFQVLKTEQLIQIDILGAVFLMSIAIFFISRYLTRPISKLLLSMKLLSAGDLQTRAPVISDDEIGNLSVGFNSMAQELEDQGFIRETFGKFVPTSIVTTALEDRGIVRPQLREATILFTDIEGFTAICEKLSPKEVIAMLNEYFAVVAEPIREAGGVITQFQGDAMLVTFNLPVEDPHHAASAVRAALGIQHITQTKRFIGDIALNTRVGINTGLVVGGTVGDGDHLGYTVHGDAVNLAARLEQLNKEYGSHILIAQRTAQLAGDGFALRKIGKISIRGHEDSILVYEVSTS